MIKVCILRTDGTNCDNELHYAFAKFGADPQFVHINELRDKSKKLKDFQILALPGGFAYGDDVASGKILAVELVSFLKDQLTEFIEKKGLILGVCNGFQALVRTGLLPFNHLGEMDTTLAQNESGHFECRWIKIKPQKSKCLFLNQFKDTIIEVPVNHGEGRFFAPPQTIKSVEDQSLVTFRYVDDSGRATQKYPQNPNGAVNAIAGVTDPSGKILGLMPHPEKIIETTQHPNWRRDKNLQPMGGIIFQSMIEYAKNN